MVDEIREAIEQGYIKAVYFDREPQAMTVFHPEFHMEMLHEGKVESLPLLQWQALIEAGKKRNPQGPTGTITYNITVVDQTEDAAVAKVELFHNDRQIYADYLSLYRLPEGWRVVAKIYHQFG
jgi:hypothetical protein